MSTYKEYQEYAEKDLIRRSDLGEKCFEDIEQEINDLKKLIDEMVEISENKDLPKGLDQNLSRILQKFVSFAKRITEYSFDGDNNFRERDKIVNEIRNYYEGIFSDDNNNQNNFLSTYNAIKNFGYDELNTLKSQLSTFKEKAKDKLDEVSEASETLKTEASKITVSDYANIFEEQADKHSSFRFSPNFSIGASEKNFIAGAIALIVFLCLIINIDFWQPTDATSWETMLPFYLRKFVILSILVFIIRFTFKQFMINKHLATLNKHRQNTLNSFRLFIESISSDDPSVKDLLLVEVSRAIYEQGKTGFLNESAKQDSNSPSIFELTKSVSKSNEA